MLSLTLACRRRLLTALREAVWSGVGFSKKLTTFPCLSISNMPRLAVSMKYCNEMWNKKQTVLFCNPFSYLGPHTSSKLLMLHFQTGQERKDTAPQFCPNQNPRKKVYHY